MDSSWLPRIRGVNERKIYKNFVKDYPREYLETVMCIAFQDICLKTKNEEKSICIRLKANETYRLEENLQECIKLYNKSLRYAIYNSENYAIVLANRSAMLFKTSQFKECIEDIDLCLKSQYPKVLKPKVYLRKCESYKKLGNREKIQESVEEFLLFLNNEVSKTDAGIYKQKLDSLLSSVEEIDVQLSDDSSDLPTMERNPKLPNASVNVALRQNRNHNFYVSCNKITKGQVLFVEKAYAFAPYTSNEKSINKKFCQYCLKRIINGVPCKTCVKYMFCSERCQNLAWSEFHQWECLAIQADMLKGFAEIHLALRIILKACYLGLQDNTSDDTYFTINNLPITLDNKEFVQIDAENAMHLVFYLKNKTDFFEYVKRWRNFKNKSEKDLRTSIGGLLIRHTNQMQSKALSVMDFYNMGSDHVALAACSLVAYMSHSCDPNTIYYFHNDNVIVKALTDIDTNTKLTYSYRNVTRYNTHLADRKMFFWNFVRLRCDCRSCQNPMLNLDKWDSYICIRCGGPANVVDTQSPINQYKCLQCNNLFVMPFLTQQKINFALMCLNKFHISENINMAKLTVSTFKHILNPYHKFYELLYFEMMVSYSMEDDPIGLFEIFKLLTDYSETRYGVKSIDNLLLQMLICKTLLEYLTRREITPPNYFIILNSLKKSLEKVAELSDLLYPPFLKEVQLLQDECLNLHVTMDRLNAANDSFNV